MNNITSVEDIIQLIMRRDNLNREEAEFLVKDCQREINFYLKHGDYEMVKETLMIILELEPDYLEVLLWKLVL